MSHPSQPLNEPIPRDPMQPGATARTLAQPGENDATKPSRGPRLTPQQLAAVRALLDGCTIPEAARRIGVIRQTVWRWLQQPGFTAELKRSHERLLSRVDRSTEPAGRTGADRSVRPSGSGRSTDSSDAEFERWVEGVFSRVSSIRR